MSIYSASVHNTVAALWSPCEGYAGAAGMATTKWCKAGVKAGCALSECPCDIKKSDNARKKFTLPPVVHVVVAAAAVVEDAVEVEVVQVVVTPEQV